MIFSPEEVLPIAESTGFRAEMIEKVLHLLNLLDKLNLHPILKGNWVLKGGTALNLFLFNLPRLSVDIFEFLSRLCGGELSLNELQNRFAFLSRLCGGEPVGVRGHDRACFLSRLCGGELIVFLTLVLIYFLSRLCGGELFAAILSV